jgi:hypothetical protein
MGRTRGLYHEEYAIGSFVKIAERNALDDFMRTWTLHNKLEVKQLDYAGKKGRIRSVGFYHGGEELYQIEDVPGMWHEECLEACAAPSDI